LTSALVFGNSGCTSDNRSKNSPVVPKMIVEPDREGDPSPGYSAFSQEDGSYIHTSRYNGNDLSFYKGNDGTPFFNYKGIEHEAKLISGEYSFTSKEGDTFSYLEYASPDKKSDWFLCKQDSVTFPKDKE